MSNSQVILPPSPSKTQGGAHVFAMPNNIEEHQRNSAEIEKINASIPFHSDTTPTLRYRSISAGSPEKFRFNKTVTIEDVRGLGRRIRSRELKSENIEMKIGIRDRLEIVGLALEAKELEVAEIYLSGIEDLLKQSPTEPKQQEVIAGQYRDISKLRGYALRYAAAKNDLARVNEVLTMGDISARDVGAALIPAVDNKNENIINALLGKLEKQDGNELDKQARAEGIAMAINQATANGDSATAKLILGKVKRTTTDAAQSSSSSPVTTDKYLQDVADMSTQKITIVALFWAIMLSIYEMINAAIRKFTDSSVVNNQ